mmetsp:Transcript_67953/g.196838  ORF Transcript_67953/g.196838 Transcript_67953/m.196838 type:complete len:227 (-) Transcript_67953:158-838(-)
MGAYGLVPRRRASQVHPVSRGRRGIRRPWPCRRHRRADGFGEAAKHEPIGDRLLPLVLQIDEVGLYRRGEANFFRACVDLNARGASDSTWRAGALGVHAPRRRIQPRLVSKGTTVGHDKLHVRARHGHPVNLVHRLSVALPSDRELLVVGAPVHVTIAVHQRNKRLGVGRRAPDVHRLVLGGEVLVRGIAAQRQYGRRSELRRSAGARKPEEHDKCGNGVGMGRSV